MKRETTNVEIDSHQVRWMLKLEDDPSEPGSDHAKRRQYEFLRDIADQPQLTFCGLERFEKLTISHNGTAWQAIGIAVERKPLASSDEEPQDDDSL